MTATGLPRPRSADRIREQYLRQLGISKSVQTPRRLVKSIPAKASVAGPLRPPSCLLFSLPSGSSRSDGVYVETQDTASVSHDDCSLSVATSGSAAIPDVPCAPRSDTPTPLVVTTWSHASSSDDRSISSRLNDVSLDDCACSLGDDDVLDTIDEASATPDFVASVPNRVGRPPKHIVTTAARDEKVQRLRGYLYRQQLRRRVGVGGCGNGPENLWPESDRPSEGVEDPRGALPKLLHVVHPKAVRRAAKKETNEERSSKSLFPPHLSSGVHIAKDEYDSFEQNSGSPNCVAGLWFPHSSQPILKLESHNYAAPAATDNDTGQDELDVARTLSQWRCPGDPQRTSATVNPAGPLKKRWKG